MILPFMKRLRYMFCVAAMLFSSCSFLDTYPEDFLTPDDFGAVGMLFLVWVV